MSFINAIGDAVRPTFCAAYKSQPQFFASINRLVPGLGELQTINDLIARNICNTEPEQPPALEPPFTGGQCPGTIYSFQLGQIIAGDCGAIFNWSPGVEGPITNLDFEITDVGGFPNNLRGTLIATGANGTFTSPQVQGNNTNLPCFTGPIPTSGPDDCGNPPPELGPPGSFTVNVDITYGDENQFELTVPVIFAPVFVNVDGTLSIPFTIEDLDLIGELKLDGTIEIKPTFNFGTGNPNTDDELDRPEPGDDDDPGDDVPEDEPDDDFGPIIAVVGSCAAVSGSRQTRIGYPDAPTVYAPRLGVVRFEYRVNASRFWTEDLPIKSLQFVQSCPIPWGATAVSVSPDPGVAVNWSVMRGRPTAIEGALTIDAGGGIDRR